MNRSLYFKTLYRSLDIWTYNIIFVGFTAMHTVLITEYGTKLLSLYRLYYIIHVFKIATSVVFSW